MTDDNIDFDFDFEATGSASAESADASPEFDFDLNDDPAVGEAAPAGGRRGNESESTAVPVRQRAASELYFDIETEPDYDRVHTFGLDPLPEPASACEFSDCPDPKSFLDVSIDEARKLMFSVTGPAEWLDAIEALEQKNKPKSRKGMLDLIKEVRDSGGVYAEAKAERVKLLSVTPEYCRIAAIGWAIGSGPVESMVAGDGGCTERAILERFWGMVDNCHPIIGFNIIRFDLPVIYTRSILLGVPALRMLETRRDVIDILVSRFGYQLPTGKGTPRKLKQLAPLYGIPVPAEGVDGGAVAGLMEAKKFDEVHRYVASDVAIERELHRKMAGYYCR